MGHAARVGHGLGPAALVLGARDAILRPDFHGHTEDIVAFLAQEVTRHAGIDASAHAEKDARFACVHCAGKVRAPRQAVNSFRALPGRTGMLTNGLPPKVNRQGNSLERLIPMRGSATTGTFSSAGRTKQYRGSVHRLISWWRFVISKACANLPGPEQRRRTSSTPRRALIMLRPRRGSSARIKISPLRAPPFTS